MALPTFLVGPAWKLVEWARDAQQNRRKVKLTVHRADLQGPMMARGDRILEIRTDSYFINITNASHDRDIVITHIWIESDPGGSGA